jgi:hypothetical protein
MKYISLEMVRDHMDHLPSFSCPGAYTIRTYVRGDERLWAEIETEAGEFANQEQALEHFREEFGPFLSEMADRFTGSTTAQPSSQRVHRLHFIPCYVMD